jgi:LysM repeat protein
MFSKAYSPSRYQIILGILLALAVLAGMLPRPAMAAVTEPFAACDKTHTVKNSETIYRIARTYNVPVNRLAKANNLVYPYKISDGMVLCIPAEPKVTGAGKFTVSFKGEVIKIDGSGFKKQYTFFVRVRENDTSKWYKIGAVRSDRNGNLLVTLDVPKQLQNKPALNVCLKDGVTDGLVCKRVYRLP